MGDADGSSGQPVSGTPRSPLLRAKLRVPVVPDHYVKRSRLLRLLDETVTCPLTLVVAPAGVGKTTLLAGWASEREADTGWLSLDESDQDPSQFWAGVIAAIERLAPGCTGVSMARLQRAGLLGPSTIDRRSSWRVRTSDTGAPTSRTPGTRTANRSASKKCA